MKINVKEVIKDYEEKDIFETGPEGKKSITIRIVIVNSLNSIIPQEAMSADDKSKVFQLSMKMYTEDNPDFTVDELSFIKTRVGKIYNPLVYGRICQIFDKKGDPLPSPSGSNVKN